MKSEILRRLLKKLPPGVSINLPGISVDPGTLAEHISKDAAPGELVELNQHLADLARNAADAFERLEADLAAAGVKNQEQFQALLAALQATLPSAQLPELPPCFLPAEDALSGLIARNFLFEFDGPESDYVELLSGDLRRLFFSLFNDHLRPGTVNRLLVSGHEGSGKSFNSLLLALQLSREGYGVHYCYDIRSASLTPDSLRSLAIREDDSTILIVDNSQHDLIKAEQLLSAISRAGTYAMMTRGWTRSAPTRPYLLTMREHFVDFERLVRL